MIDYLQIAEKYLEKLSSPNMEIFSENDYFTTVIELRKFFNEIASQNLEEKDIIKELREKQYQLEMSVKTRIKFAIIPNTRIKDSSYIGSLVQISSISDRGDIYCRDISKESSGFLILPPYFNDKYWIPVSDVLKNNGNNILRKWLNKKIIRKAPTKDKNYYGMPKPVELLFIGKFNIVVKDQEKGMLLLPKSFIDNNWILYDEK